MRLRFPIYGGMRDWKCDLFLNAFCTNNMKLSENEHGYYGCGTGAGYTFDLQQALYSVEEVLYSSEINFASEESSYTARSTYNTSATAYKRQLSTTADVPSISQTPLVTTIKVTQTSSTLGPTRMSSATPTPTSYAVPTAVNTTMSSRVLMSAVSYAVPFVFYMLGMANAIVLIFTLPGTWSGEKRRSFLNLIIALVRQRVSLPLRHSTNRST